MSSPSGQTGSHPQHASNAVAPHRRRGSSPAPAESSLTAAAPLVTQTPNLGLAGAGPGVEHATHVSQLKTAIRILRLREVEQRIGLKRSSIYARLSPHSKQFDPLFPKPISLVARTGSQCRRKSAIGWIASELEEYLARLCSDRAA